MMSDKRTGRPKKQVSVTTLVTGKTASGGSKTEETESGRLVRDGIPTLTVESAGEDS